MNTMLNIGSFEQMSSDEAFFVDGGDPARQKMLAEIRANHSYMKNKKPEDDKNAILYTIGYLSVATCWCGPLSTALGVIGLLYSCMD